MNFRLTRRDVIVLAPGMMTLPLTPLPLQARAQAATPSTSSPVAAPAAADLDAILAAAVERGLPGVALAIERDGDPVYAGVAGVASIERKTPADIADRFRLGSITKAFTAIIVLQLAEEGVLALDDTVTAWLDAPEVARIPNVDTVTVRQLLNHTSGIYDYLDEDDSQFVEVAYLAPDADWTKVWTVPELLAYAEGKSHAPYFAPGEGFHYSNTGYLLLGLIVEQATGHPFDDALKRRILDPLMLDDTALEMGKVVSGNVVDCYESTGGEMDNVTALNLTWAWTAGAMVSTIGDLARFARAVFDGELLSASSYTEMFTYTPEPRIPGAGWGMGVWTIPSPNGMLLAGGGGGPGFTASMVRLQEENLTAVATTNMSGDGEGIDIVRDEAIRVVLAASGRSQATIRDATPSTTTSRLAGLGYPELRIVVTDAGPEVPREVATGRSLVVLENRGTPDGPAAVSDVTILQLPEGVTLDDFNALFAANADTLPDWFDDIDSAGGFNVAAGQTGYGVIDLQPGDWYIGVGDTNPFTSLTVTGDADASPTPSAVPPADISLELTGAALDLPDQIPVGSQVWHVTNVGDQPHEVVLIRTPELVTVEQVLTIVALPEGASPPPGVPDPATFEFLPSGVKTMSPGHEMWVELDLTPGNYVAICLSVDPDTGQSHALSGEVHVFTVGQPATPSG
jgi:D-alanyl-D-alanine carboxypeptidase